ncbi:TonB-linked SusC/RagA family outer membrane protein [Hymenobacter luteus]|uniref:TonB-linked SusC/RagA family outer membrane protein n=2 Tax=Hymenobacter TaxID=89966 RepID=A0A7W9WBL1_9BACT|nr:MULTISPECIES: TonB-dependent receptor [Hymenobacter]MBB4601623.1 TonB-linked SusC/RagA family outer membrane protein [Hymenobacter latericoloratus]MBB6059949.1 TonB-linked SusC/RagA family outer membrane protein [Hymenobacter luteus]
MKNPLPFFAPLQLKRAALLPPLCLAVLSSAAAAHPFSQQYLEQPVTLQAQDETMQAVLTTIENQTKVRFQYSRQLIGAGRRVSIQAENQPLGQVLHRLFDPLRIAYEPLPSGIVLKPAAKPAADITVSGRVLDEKGSPLPGVNVVVKGTSIGTQTDADGRYTLAAPEGATLVFSFVGYTAQEVAIAGRTSIDVSFAPNQAQLNEVVVVGYGTQQKRDVTGSIASVKGDVLVNQASQNPVSSLQGKVAGVQITNNGQPGASPQIRIRGTGSIQGSANPLYVVDGTFVDDISFINQEDIASIEILKDASSAAIYGVRAANGVVLVTTKRGKAGAPRINYNGFGGVQRVTNKVDMVDAAEYATLINERTGTQTLATNLPSTDWFDQITRTAAIHNHQLSLSGGSEKISYSLSGSYLKQQGIVKNNDYERITARLQTDFSPTDHIKVGYSAIFQNFRSTDVPADVLFYQAFVAPPVLPVFKANGNYGDAADFPLGNFANPSATLARYNQKSNGQQLVGNIYASLNFLNAFTFRTSLGLNYGIAQYRNYQAKDSLTTTQFAQRSLLTASNGKNNRWLWENTLTYDKTIADDHRLTFLLGVSSQRDQSNQTIGSVNDVPYFSESSLYLGLGTATTARIQTNADKFTFASYFGRLNYAFRDRYLLTATLRRDGSSKFSPDKRFGTFPSVGVGWVVSEEVFLKDGVFDQLKLRASWGRLGNNNIPSSISILTVSNSPGYTAIFGGSPFPGRNVNALEARVLDWETTTETDAGIDVGFLDNRLTATLDFYNRRVNKAIFDIPIPGTGGLADPRTRGNYASLRNRGVELTVGWNNQTTERFSYTTGFNVTYNQNRVLDLQAIGADFPSGNLPVGGVQTTITRVGLPLGSFLGYVVDGIFQTEDEVNNSPQAGSGAAPGSFRYRDLNNDGVIDANDRQIIGNPNPRFTYGVNLGFRYASFDVALDVQGVAGVEIYNATKGVRYGNENYTQDFYDNRWRGPGTSNSYPSAAIGGSDLNANTWYVEKGDYIRLRNVQLGYTLAKSFASTLRVQGIRFYANAQNPLTLFKYKGFTPEVGQLRGSSGNTSQGIDLNVYPLSATYNLGVNVTF